MRSRRWSGKSNRLPPTDMGRAIPIDTTDARGVFSRGNRSPGGRRTEYAVCPEWRKPNVENNGKIKVAIIGVGNCASSLVQGVEFYKNTSDEEHIPGLMHTNLGGYRIRDIEFTAAFDVNVTKVGKDLSEAI